jgi:hypothetical protein
VSSSRNPFRVSPETLPELHQKIVAVITHFGTPVSMGRLRVHPATGKTLPRVEVVFHTENVSCALTIDPAVLEAISPVSDSIHFRYRLPPGDELWAPTFGPRRESSTDAPEQSPAAGAAANEAQIETYPLPPDYRLTGYSTAPTRPQGRDSVSPQPTRRGQR